MTHSLVCVGGINSKDFFRECHILRYGGVVHVLVEDWRVVVHVTHQYQDLDCAAEGTGTQRVVGCDGERESGGRLTIQLLQQKYLTSFLEERDKWSLYRIHRIGSPFTSLILKTEVFPLVME